ncbi:energy-coupling factor ABC transporter ATP-binding protein [Thioclava sp. 15-R06ZXC-3]|uniref:Energy-coupling factor ABC transporter ATP-binding protein n=1 Tax=Thioclava arctica TaxID=3238301 RepID=A0ABV3TKG9_9RHOB
MTLNRMTAKQMQEAPEAQLTLADVSVRIEERPVLNQLSLDVSFRRLGIVGRNGSGKSTFARLLAGLIAPQDGLVRLNGVDVFGDRRAALREVGILFQNPDHQIIFPTVLEEVAFGLAQLGRKAKQAERDAHEILARFQKSQWAQMPISTLSHGQKHLVCLMSIVAMSPKVVVLDEPFAGLDMPTKAQLSRYLQLFGGTVIHISHDPKDLADCETVLWLEKGQIARAGAAPDVLNDYLEAMTKLGEGDDISDLSR